MLMDWTHLQRSHLHDVDMVRNQQRYLRCLGVAEKKEVANRVAVLEEQSQPTIETRISNLLSLS
jgi:hypothetical protein